jgi:hypothetical protein
MPASNIIFFYYMTCSRYYILHFCLPYILFSCRFHSIVPVTMHGEITPLSELRPIGYLYNIHVRVSRAWEYRGKSENNDLIHFDMVLIDQKA